jgi:hypothetical protein
MNHPSLQGGTVSQTGGNYISVSSLIIIGSLSGLLFDPENECETSLELPVGFY